MNTEEQNTAPVKGAYGQLCYRTACNNTSAIFYNHSTREHYCAECANLINSINHRDAMQLYGHALCTLVQPKTKCTAIDEDLGIIDELLNPQTQTK